MRRSKGFSLTELLVVVGIILLLSGIIYAVMAPARVKAKQTTCMGNLKQLYTASALYSSDNQEGTTYDFLNDHVSLPGDLRRALGPYGVTPGQLICPQVPSALQGRFMTSYTFMNLLLDSAPATSGLGAQAPSMLSMISGIHERAKEKMPLIYCGVEDELIYQKSDPPSQKTPFLIYVTTTGSAHAERAVFLEHRPKLLTILFK